MLLYKHKQRVLFAHAACMGLGNMSREKYQFLSTVFTQNTKTAAVKNTKTDEIIETVPVRLAHR